MAKINTPISSNNIQYILMNYYYVSSQDTETTSYALGANGEQYHHSPTNIPIIIYNFACYF